MRRIRRALCSNVASVSEPSPSRHPHSQPSEKHRSPDLGIPVLFTTRSPAPHFPSQRRSRSEPMFLSSQDIHRQPSLCSVTSGRFRLTRASQCPLPRDCGRAIPTPPSIQNPRIVRQEPRVVELSRGRAKTLLLVA